MPSSRRASGEEASRRRKAHKKSRGGCRNCKLRRIKCDEAKPECQKCISFGVSCNYDSKTPDLHTGPDQLICFDTPKSATVTKPAPEKHLVPANQPVQPKSIPIGLFAPFVVGDKLSTLELDSSDLERFKRFLVRTVLTVGTPSGARVFQKVMPELAFGHPYLMHITQAMTAAHDRYLSPTSPPKQSVLESYHLTRGLALFATKLSQPLQDSDRDSLWASAALLGIIVVSAIEATAPEEAWPLKKSEPEDLEWMKMSESKHVVWRLTDPLRKGSLFRTSSQEWVVSKEALPQPPARGVAGVPQAFIDLFKLDDTSTAENNPYFEQVHILSSVLTLPPEQPTIVRFLSFMNTVHSPFRELMKKKDPRALLLLAYWYATVIEGRWWIVRRARMECQAICLYLERECKNNVQLMELLEYPKITCGLVR